LKLYETEVYICGFLHVGVGYEQTCREHFEYRFVRPVQVLGFEFV
jgi:hypothetical protein